LRYAVPLRHPAFSRNDFAHPDAVPLHERSRLREEKNEDPVSSEKQIAASRLNALKSTGPRTPDGKAESALNATRHMTLARSILLRCESPERFSAFVENFHREYQPRTATELTLMNTIASARWPLMRMSHVEAVNVDSEYVKEIEPPVVPLNFETADRAGFAYRDLVRNS
jgi:hypothetical protein